MVPLYWVSRGAARYGWEGPALLVGDAASGLEYTCIYPARYSSSSYAFRIGDSADASEYIHLPTLVPYNEEGAQVNLRWMENNWLASGPLSEEALAFAANNLGFHSGRHLATVLRRLPDLMAEAFEAGRLTI